MNTDTHLDVEELLAGAASEHLATCPDCRAEQARWAKVAAGTQQLATATDLPEWQFPTGPAAPAARRPRRRVLLTAAAAVVLAAAGTTWGLAGRGTGTPSATAAGLTAVTGCPTLGETGGILERVHGTRLVVRTPGGQDIPVTAAGPTAVHAIIWGSLSDITNGAEVQASLVAGHGTFQARGILVNRHPDRPYLPGGAQVPVQPGQRFISTRGTVSNVHPGGFTITQPDGQQLQVATTSATRVTVMVVRRTDQLRAGQAVLVVGEMRGDHVLAAAIFEEGPILPSIVVEPNRTASGSCEPAAVAAALALGGF
jgi:hypothetical protein